MIEIVRGDITRLDVDAIVNAASGAFRGGGGVDGAIHRAAGPALLEECRRYPRLPTGEAILTNGYHLRARHIIHTVGPVWHGGTRSEPRLLKGAYRSVFRVAVEHGGIRTIAFPAISTGVYGYPKAEAARIAVAVIREHEARMERIIACLYDDENTDLYRKELA